MPVEAISAAVIAAVSRVLLTKVVVLAEPFHRTVEPLMKLLPLSVRLKVAPPAVAELGEMPDKAGAGLTEVPFITCPTVSTIVPWPERAASQLKNPLSVVGLTE